MSGTKAALDVPRRRAVDEHVIGSRGQDQRSRDRVGGNEADVTGVPLDRGGGAACEVDLVEAAVGLRSIVEEQRAPQRNGVCESMKVDPLRVSNRAGVRWPGA